MGKYHLRRYQDLQCSEIVYTYRLFKGPQAEVTGSFLGNSEEERGRRRRKEKK